MAEKEGRTGRRRGRIQCQRGGGEKRDLEKVSFFMCARLRCAWGSLQWYARLGSARPDFPLHNFLFPREGGSGLELASCLEALPGCPSPSTSFSLASSFTVPLIFVFLLGKYELASSSSLRFHFLAGWGRKCETAMSENPGL